MYDPLRKYFCIQIALHYTISMLYALRFIVFELEVKFIFIYRLQRCSTKIPWHGNQALLG